MFKYLALFALALSLLTASAADTPSKKPFRILHVMSYHATWKWNREQFQAFKAALADVDVEYRVVELDTKRNSDPAAIREKVEEAKRLIAEWQPDLLYANDDNAQSYLARQYVNTGLPIVFSAVNRDPSEYGFTGAGNVTGVLEQEHFIPTLRLLRQITGPIRRIAVIVDSDPTWEGVMARMRSSLRQIPDLEITRWVLVRDLQQFRREIAALQDEVDAIAMLGVFNIKDEQGNDVDYERIQRWVVEHSGLPDFSFWETRVERGTLCAVVVSGYEQGHLAGTMARQILVDGVAPGAIPIQPSSRGFPMLSLARARRLGLKLDVNLLLNVKTLTDFTWER